MIFKFIGLALWESVHSEQMQIATAEIRLRIRAVWSGPSLSAYRILNTVEYIDA